MMEANLSELENRLQGGMQPVTPDPDFVKKLKERLIYPHRDHILMETSEPNLWAILVSLVLMGSVIGLIVHYFRRK